jgi:hypothetical protein
MSNPTPSQLKRLAKIIDELGFSVETDNTGQVVLYTGLMFGENGELVRWVDEEDLDKPLGGQWEDNGEDDDDADESQD